MCPSTPPDYSLCGGILTRRFQKFIPRSSVEAAVAFIVKRPYCGLPSPTKPPSDKTPTKTERTAEIRARNAASETVIDLAAEYGISQARVYQIISKRKT